MNAEKAWAFLGDTALAAAQCEAERLSVYDALAALAAAAGMSKQAADARATAEALRGAETMELRFRRDLTGGEQASNGGDGNS